MPCRAGRVITLPVSEQLENILDVVPASTGCASDFSSVASERSKSHEIPGGKTSGLWRVSRWHPVTVMSTQNAKMDFHIVIRSFFCKLSGIKKALQSTLNQTRIIVSRLYGFYNGIMIFWFAKRNEMGRKKGKQGMTKCWLECPWERRRPRRQSRMTRTSAIPEQ